MRVRVILVCLIACLLLPMASAEGPLGTPREGMDSLSEAFAIVPANPLPEGMADLLWLIAQDVPEPQAADTAPSPLAEAAAKYEELIRTQGVHYTETTSTMGMNMKAEYWLRGGKYKKNDQTSKQTYLYDGEWFYMYATKGKTGVRMAPDDPDVSAVIGAMGSGMLSLLAAAPYEQQEDQKIKGFDCQVFYMDVDMMGMKGNWLFVDKQTGALVKNQYGDGKGGMVTTVTKLEVGKFGDEAFALPKNLKVTGP